MFCLVAAIAGVPSIAHAQEPPVAYFHPANILRFADALFGEGEYRPAIAEYKRYLMTGAGTASEQGRVHFKLGLSLRMLGDADAAISSFHNAAQADSDPVFVTDCRLQIAYTYLMAGRWAEADVALKSAESAGAAVKRPLVSAVHAARHLLARDWRRGFAQLRATGAAERQEPLWTELQQIAEEGLALPRRSPWIAGILSGVVPGAGRIYAGRKADGLVSMLTISLIGWQAYRGFERDGRESVRGWVLGSIGTVLYVGNVYGSAVSVRVMNERAVGNLRKRTELSLSVALR